MWKLKYVWQLGKHFFCPFCSDNMLINILNRETMNQKKKLYLHSFPILPPLPPTPPHPQPPSKLAQLSRCAACIFDLVFLWLSPRQGQGLRRGHQQSHRVRLGVIQLLWPGAALNHSLSRGVILWFLPAPHLTQAPLTRDRLRLCTVCVFKKVFRSHAFVSFNVSVQTRPLETL